jgi:hypothetical protein
MPWAPPAQPCVLVLKAKVRYFGAALGCARAAADTSEAIAQAATNVGMARRIGWF